MIRGNRRSAAQPLGQAALCVYFVLVDLWLIVPSGPGMLGADAGLYTRAAIDWLTGRDPWNLGGSWLVYQFSGLPPTVLSFVPFAMMGETLAKITWIGLSFAAGAWIVRRSGRSWTWMLYPPLLFGMLIGNPHTLIVGLALTRLGAIAPLPKVYGAVFLVAEKRWTALAFSVALIGASVVVAPDLWRDWLANAGTINTRLVFQAQGGWSLYLVWPLALVLGLVALWRLGWRAAGWWAVPLAWPATEYIYGSALLPVASTAALCVAAIPLPFMVGPALLVEVALHRRPEAYRELAVAA